MKYADGVIFKGTYPKRPEEAVKTGEDLTHAKMEPIIYSARGQVDRLIGLS